MAEWLYNFIMYRLTLPASLLIKKYIGYLGVFYLSPIIYEFGYIWLSSSYHLSSFFLSSWACWNL